MLGCQPFSLSSNTLRGIHTVQFSHWCRRARSGLLFVKMFKLCICLTESSTQMSQFLVGSLPSLPRPPSGLGSTPGVSGPTALAHGRGRWRWAGANYRPSALSWGLQAPGWGLPGGALDLPVWDCVTPQECGLLPHLRIPECNPLVSPLYFIACSFQAQKGKVTCPVSFRELVALSQGA